LSSQQDKLQEAHQHFKEILGEAGMRHKVVQWAALDYSPFSLGELDIVIQESEIKNVVVSLHSEKAPGPDGFIGLFYKCYWTLVKEDLTAAINDFYNFRCKNLHLVNEANVVLLPKKEVLDSIDKFRPISLINSFMKIVTKILANRLAPRMNEIVSVAQNAFIQKRSIHDNFLYVQRVIMKMHKRGQPALFIKLDISRAFDSINWAYLLDVLKALGFSQRWRDWIALILGSSSSKIIINGEQTNRINHKRGVRQGDPLSPFLFILAMDPLQRMIDKAAQARLLGSVLPKGAKLRCSLYADDVAVFVRADKTDLKVLKTILEVFEGCLGLKINFDKTEIFPIRYPESFWSNLVEVFLGKYANLPGKYLGLPLHFRKIKRISLQPLLEKINNRLAGWKGRLLSKAGRETLVKSVLTDQPIYHLTIFPVQK
jgi:retron-type reverse transcriptase